MPRPFPTFRTAILLAALLAAGAPSAARTQAPAPVPPAADAATLQGRMRAFLDSLERGRAAGFFPARGEWTWVQTTHTPDGDRVGTWRFRPQDTAPAMEVCGPLFGSFAFLPHGQPVGGLMHRAFESQGKWRRVRGNRFVPAGQGAGSPVFVEWRREDGRWVVAAFGDEGWQGPRLLGQVAGMVRFDTTQATPADAYITGESWYTRNEPVTAGGYRYIRYGHPRPIGAAELTWAGRLGGARVYVERGIALQDAEVIYLPTGPGQYQPYMTERNPVCRRR